MRYPKELKGMRYQKLFFLLVIVEPPNDSASNQYGIGEMLGLKSEYLCIVCRTTL